ncbi:hypothetical protein I6M88_12600 [Citrobacter sedlakii]|uniref:Uncharacterized protein n=1 Tax=Citrobacter sedlakii TaxID=67826 RepID=A0ABS0ZSJ5_9ENTR|nr:MULTISPECIES: hypothetical protein [Citrobacter]EHG7612016.1 hypothetical protein [Citrobacter sedlakii]MBJ8381805.1 hypothetical protein [Citrobacter sedlakii]MBJ9888529.1 hypothetical protein [Citrobacter sedlakii]MBM9567299.1 hypothetical protein [Citrobacter sedlakii]MEB0951839.1 hypothetical protein [Citrobacter sedlakii]
MTFHTWQLFVGRSPCVLLFYNWQEKYKKRQEVAHRATTQHFRGITRRFVAKAQGNGSDFTEMKSSQGIRPAGEAEKAGV